MEAKELTKLAVKALEDKKGEDIRVIDIHGVSVLADYFVIADGHFLCLPDEGVPAFPALF